MKTYEKRGFIKIYTEEGVLVSKISVDLIQEEVIKEEEDLFEDEQWDG